MSITLNQNIRKIQTNTKLRCGLSSLIWRVPIQTMGYIIVEITLQRAQAPTSGMTRAYCVLSAQVWRFQCIFIWHHGAKFRALNYAAAVPPDMSPANLQRFQNKSLRLATNWSRCTKITNLHDITKTEPLRTYTDKLSYHFYKIRLKTQHTHARLDKN